MKKLFTLLLVLTFLQGCGFEIVDTGHRGVETRYGKVNSGSLPEGLYFYNPVTSDMKEMDVRIKKFSGKTAPYTKDVQLATVEYVVNYNLNKTKVHEVLENVGTDYEEILIPQAVKGALKTAIGKWDAVTLVSKREQARAEAQETLRQTLNSKNVNVTRLELVDIDYGDKFEKSIERKVVAIQKAEEAKNNTVRIQEEADQAEIKAQGEAKAIEIRAAAIAKNPALVQYEAVLKWDGKLPQFTGSGAVPFINIDSKTGKMAK